MDRARVSEKLLLLALPFLVVWGLWSYGLWDPWELQIADAARGLIDHLDHANTKPPLSMWATTVAFELLGVREWTGRVPFVLAGLCTCALAFVFLQRTHGRQAGIIAAVVTATSPLFLLNARHLTGAAVEMFAQAWVGVAAFAWARHEQRGAPSGMGLLALLAAGVVSSTFASGVLLGPLPPILAVGLWAFWTERARTPVWRQAGVWTTLLLAALLIMGVAGAVAADGATLSLWLGGAAPGTGEPPTFEAAAELIFHGFAPWSAMLPVAALWAASPRTDRRAATQDGAWVMLLWAGFSYAAWTLFSSRYGMATYLAVVPLAGLVSIWLAELSTGRAPQWTAAVVVLLLVGLLIRDFALYPESAIRGLPIEELEFPSGWNPSASWALLFGGVGIVAWLTLTSSPSSSRPQPKRVFKAIAAEWQQGVIHKAWLSLAGLLLLGCLVFGLVCLFVQLPLASALVRWGRKATAVPLVVAALVWGVPWVYYAFGKLRARGTPLLLWSGVGLAFFVTLVFQPALSQHLSPRDVYDSYHALSGGRDEPLAVYRAPTTGQYYVSEPLTEIKNETALLDYLEQPGQKWLILPTELLAEVDRAYRRREGRHLFVASAKSARLLLAAAEPVPDMSNENFIAASVLSEAPTPQYLVGANFENRIELIGFDLGLPHEDYVGAGEKFSITWYWKVTGRTPGAHQVFLHIDGHGQRLNGDHVPVEGRYPLNYWEPGDVVVDKQQLTVPGNYPVGDYALLVGFFSGSTRLKVVAGPNDGDDRVKAGVLPVR